MKKERKKLIRKSVHKDYDDCSSSSLDLFLLLPTQSSLQKGKSIDYHPVTSLSDGGPIEFKVYGSGKEFLDLARSYLYLKVKVLKEVGFANYPIASLFNQVDVILGGKLISSATNTYAHRSILEVLLNYDQEAAGSQLGCGFFCKDTAGKMEEMDITADPSLNKGLETRRQWTKTSNIVELQGRIHSDLFNPSLHGRGGGKFAPRRFFCYSSKTIGARLPKLCDFIVSLLYIIWYTFWSPGT